MLAEAGINVISIAESDLAGTGYQPHGYAEYKTAPNANLKSSVNNAGQTVYKVFNNKIPMNWEEFRYLMLHLKKALNQTYSYFSEYWFEYESDFIIYTTTNQLFSINDNNRSGRINLFCIHSCLI